MDAVDKHLVEGDRLFLIAESLAQDFSLFPARAHESLKGVVSDAAIRRQTETYDNLDIDSYIEAVVSRADDPSRTPAPVVIAQLGRIIDELSDGPYYQATLEMDFDGEPRPVCFIAQDRRVNNGAWGPEHHLMAASAVETSSRRSLPIVSLMDTPGASSDADANARNQAHSISRLIAEMSNVDVPNLGIIFGIGYSGGAIPLAASNMILGVRDGVFSTIQPPALASIARRLNLSWQECAKYVGLSPYELYVQGNIDGVIDYAPDADETELGNLRLAIVSGIQSVENRVREFVSENDYILDHYRQSLQRYLNPSAQLKVMQTSASLKLTKNPTEYLNVFGVAYRYLRYLKVRRRIRSTTTQAYGRLADQELPTGELDVRAERERRLTFIKWLQDPDKVVYDDALSRAWKSYREKREVMDDERGRIAQLIFGEPKKNFEDARSLLLSMIGIFLYNRWKSESVGNLRALKQFLLNYADARQIVRVQDVRDPRALLDAINADPLMLEVCFARFAHEGKKMLRGQGIDDKSDAYLTSQVAAEVNLAITSGGFASELGDELSAKAHELLVHGASDIAINRQILEDRVGEQLAPRQMSGTDIPANELTVLDVLLEEDLREAVISECESLLLFDSVYDQIIANLDSIAEEADRTRALAKSSLSDLLGTTFAIASRSVSFDSSAEEDALRDQFFAWYERILSAPKSSDFLRTVEEWKKVSFPHLSDTLFVVVTFLFETLLKSYLVSESDGKTYDGRLALKNIGRKKDFWNRLTIAYRDLLIQNTLRASKNRGLTSHEAFLDRYFEEFDEFDEELLSSDPRAFPGFRTSIEGALQKGQPPCGVITGIGDFKLPDGNRRVGTVISNAGFQAGSFDMASAEKFCKLMVRCAEEHIPIVCFISSAGMQTKEGAGALFSMAAVNDRITRFVRDHDLPVVIFGYGDCTGGAQASFVTHPLVQTYYFSGTNMPFAGQIVTRSNLPSTSTLSNYLSLTEGSMQGLVQHPLDPELEPELQQIDPEMPMPQLTVEGVVARVMSGTFSQERPVVIAHRPRYTEEDLVKPVRKVLIHARGCTADKLIRIAHRHDIEVVLVQSDPDMESVIVDRLNERDTLVCIGGNTPDESYLNAMSVVSVAEHEGVDALHPGIGFLSENSGFAGVCRSHGINFIGPPVASMETMGNKSNAINTALSLSVPVVPGSHGILTDVERASEVAAEIGYPVLVKAVHGGGGKGIQVVEDPSRFHELFHRVTVEARAAFGNGDVYLEKFVTSLRHIEVQLLRDTHGNTRVLGLRDCSVQRDKQKVIEESGSTMLPPELEESVLRHTAAIADEVGYVGAGTVEFIYDLPNNAVYFMEMNTRLQVEHPVTEWVSGVDIVGEQFRIAAGESIAGLEIEKDGYAMEARVNAERIQLGADGSLMFRPHPGQVLECEYPEEEGVEIITSIGPGKFVSPFYDSMVAQIVVHAADRNAAADKLLAYLKRVTITGICTNIPLLLRILDDEVFRAGDYDTDYLPGLLRRIDVTRLITDIEATAGSATDGLSVESIAIEGSDELKVLSPATAIFYITPSPTEPEYVSVGDQIDVNHTLCQLEAMKIFSPVTLADFNAGDAQLYNPDQRFEVTRINNGNGQQVNAGDLLFVVRPIAVARQEES